MIKEIALEELFRIIFPIFEYGSLLFSIIFFKKFKNYSFYKFFMLYLFNIIAFKIIDMVIGDGISGKESNFDLFNFYTFFEFNLIALIYYHLIESKKYLKLVTIIAIVFNVIYFSSFYFTYLKLYTVQIEGFVNSILITIYFIELLNSEKVLNYKKIFPFWMSVGFLLFYLVSIPFFTLLYSNLFNKRLMFVLLYSLIIVFHSCFIYGLIVCKKAKV